MAKPRSNAIRQYIIDNIPAHPDDIAGITAKRFGITRQAVSRHLNKLVEEGAIEKDGRTKATRYSLRPLAEDEFTVDVAGLEEDVLWRQKARPLLEEAPDNILAICNYGFTEIVNNVIDHSESERMTVQVLRTPAQVDMKVHDFGIGIFSKIARNYQLVDEHEAILQLAKGKLTTDPEHHTGEGIFFTSRMFDSFSILSGELFFLHYQPDNDWLIEDREGTENQGTYVRMIVSLRSTLHPSNLFEKYASSPEEMTFSKTHVPVSLAQYGTDNLVSRSQARRVLSRFEKFEEVFLDFAGVEFIGQAFADEIFRVYRREHSDVKLVAINANPVVGGMIQHVIERGKEIQLELFPRK